MAARWKTRSAPSNSSFMRARSLTLASTNRNRGLAVCWARFPRRPTAKSSITKTLRPSATNASTRWLPMNPAPPVTISNSAILAPVSAPAGIIARSPSARKSRPRRRLFRRDALPGQLAVLLARFGLPRRRAQDHAAAIEADLAHLVAADPARVGCGIHSGDEARPVERIVAAIGAVGTRRARRQLRPAVTRDGHHPPLGVEHDAPHAFPAVRSRQD